MNSQFANRPLVLVVEDEAPPGRALASALATHGFRTIHAPARVEAVVARAAGQTPDVVLVDASVPSLDAVALTASIRAWTAAPIVTIFDRSTADRRSDLLDAGANDYIGWPFGPSDLAARMRVWLRQKARTQGQRLASDSMTERLRIDRDRRSLFVDGREVHLTPLECKLFLVLAHNQGRALMEDQILTALWGPKAATRAPYLRAHVRQLRLKMEKDPAKPRYLVTDSGGGYRLKLG